MKAKLSFFTCGKEKRKSGKLLSRAVGEANTHTHDCVATAQRTIMSLLAEEGRWTGVEILCLLALQSSAALLHVLEEEPSLDGRHGVMCPASQQPSQSSFF